MPNLRVLRRALVLTAVLSVCSPALVLAQDPVDQPPDFAAVRERFEGLTRAEWEAAGYRAQPPVCIASPAGGMGIHAVNAALHQAQFPTAALDPENPPVLLVDATQTRVIGLEWEEKDIGQEPPTIFGQTVQLLPGHPGVPEPHYMFHAYFRPNGQVLFATWDPQLSCRAAAGTPPALPSAGEAPNPVALPNTGHNNLPALGLLVTALALLVLGIRLRRRYA